MRNKRTQQSLRAHKERQAKRHRIGIKLFLCIVCLIALGAAAFFVNVKAPQDSDKTKTIAKKNLKIEQAKPDETITLAAVGDNILHMPIVNNGKQSDGSRNYDSVYAPLKEEISACDIAIVNQETPFTNSPEKYSGFPNFGGPTEIGDALVNAGFDVMQLASNHSYDQGADGILENVNYWRTNHPEITTLGMHDSQEDYERIRVVEKGSIKIAMLNYTQMLNGYRLPSGKEYLVDLFDKEKVAADIQRAKEISNCIIVFLHAGTEYSTEPDETVQDWTNFLAEQGVTVMIGTHPHVLQKYETVTAANGNKMLAYYSLGNFLSTQEYPYNLLGGMARFQLTFDGKSEKVSVTGHELVPLVTHYNSAKKGNAIYKLSDYTAELAAAHGVHSRSSQEFTLDSLNKMFENIVNNSH